jgi:thiamine pyrophosphate-dependent acetolactate synthase large subunit-like protein
VAGSDTPLESGAALIADRLERRGGHVFGLPGSSMVALYNELAARRIRYVPAVHESVAMAAADGYSRVAGLTYVLTYMLPGAANSTANLYNAYRDESPLVVLCAQQATEYRSHEGTVGEADTVRLVEPFTRLAWEVSDRRTLDHWLEAAARVAAGPVGGPTFLSLPKDVLEESAPRVADRPPGCSAPVAPSSVDTVVDRLVQASRPLIVVGGQVRRSDGSSVVEELAERYSIPVAYEPFWNDRLSIDPGHPCAVGPLTEGSTVGVEADVVVVVGARFFNEIHPHGHRWFQNASFVAHVNADPQKVQQTRTADWSCAADAAEFLLRLQAALATTPHDEGLLAARAAHLDAIRLRREGRRRTPSSPVVEALSSVLDDGWLVDESVSANQELVFGLTGRRGDRYISTTGGSLGWSIGASCGVALASGEPVTCVLGDGALLFGAQGLWTVRALDLNITTVVLDNGGYGSTRWFEQQYTQMSSTTGFDAEFLGSDLRGLGGPVEDVMNGFGVSTTRLRAGDDISHALKEAWADPGPRGIVIETPFS